MTGVKMDLSSYTEMIEGIVNKNLWKSKTPIEETKKESKPEIKIVKFGKFKLKPEISDLPDIE